MSQILIVEDEREIRELIALHVRREGWQVAEAGSTEEARDLIGREKFDLVFVDWMLPGESGLTLVRYLRAHFGIHVGVMVVTAKADAADVVEALDAGADDYVAKPFEPVVLLARARAILRRLEEQRGSAKGAAPADQARETFLRVGDIEVNLAKFEVRVGGAEIQLTASEFKMLTILMKNLGRVFTREALISKIQGEDITVVGRSIDTHVFGLRRKLGPAGDLIETVRGVGYRVRER